MSISFLNTGVWLNYTAQNKNCTVKPPNTQNKDRQTEEKYAYASENKNTSYTNDCARLIAIKMPTSPALHIHVGDELHRQIEKI